MLMQVCPQCRESFGPLDALCPNCGVRLAPAPTAEPTVLSGIAGAPSPGAVPGATATPSNSGIDVSRQPTTRVDAAPPPFLAGGPPLPPSPPPGAGGIPGAPAMAPPGYRRFRYTGRDAAGQPVSGEITAASEAHALSQLREGGMFVSSVQDRGSAGSSKGEDSVLQVIFSGAPLKARSFFFRQLSMLIRSGISAGEALRVLASQTTNHVLQDIAAQGAQQCTAGGKMSDAFRRHPRVFSSVVIEMVTAGEEAGHLEQFLDRIADYLEREYQIASKIRTALAYPMVVFLALIFVPNVPTLVLKGFRPYAAATFPWFLEIMAVAVGAWLLSRVLLAVPSIALAFDHIKLSLPIIGKVTRQFAIGKFGRTLAMMYGAGISLSRALRVASASCGNRYMAQELAKTVPVVESGGRLTDAIRATGCFPVMTTHIMDTGERTGNVDEMVTKLAEFAEQDANAAVDQGIALILPVAIIILAILVVPSLIKSYTSYATNEVTAADH